jgi:hypothetical protein
MHQWNLLSRLLLNTFSMGTWGQQQQQQQQQQAQVQHATLPHMLHSKATQS